MNARPDKLLDVDASGSNLLPIRAAASACGVPVGTLRRWVRNGLPQARRGRRGRGGGALFDVQTIRSFQAARNGSGGSTAALEVLAADVPAIVAESIWRAWQLVAHDPLLTGHARRTLAGGLIVSWTEITTALRDRIAIDAPDVPEISIEPEIESLARHLRPNR